MAKKSSILINMLGFNSAKINDILLSFVDLDDIFKASWSDFKKIPSLRSSDISKLMDLRDSVILDQEIQLIEKEEIKCLDIFDQDYPLLLKEISSPPLVLYLKGQASVLNKFLFAIVGSRMPTNYGVSVAKIFSEQLSRLGIVVVSGLARGIDAVAHREAVKTGQSVAVLGSGLHNIYPNENKELAKIISDSGAVVSEFPLRTGPLKENFPRRNRIVSGLSKGVLVIEAASRSGALITARLACEQNREVFAVPGNIDSPLSAGTNRIIKEGAKLVNSLEDILEELNLNLKPDLNLELTHI